MKIRDNETGEVFEYGTNIHHALRISGNGGYLTFENLQNGDGSLKSGDGGYSFVLDDGKTPEESISADAVNGATYANIGGFRRDNTKNDGWIPAKEKPAEDGFYVATMSGTLADQEEPFVGLAEFEDGNWVDGDDVIAWRPLPEPYRAENKTEASDWRQDMLRKSDRRD